MNKTLQWVIGIGVVVVVAAVVFATIWPLFVPGTGWSGFGMMGPGHMRGGGMIGPGHMRGGGMMGGWGMPFFGLGMLLWPLVIIGLIVIGGVWLVRGIGAPGARQLPPESSGQACAHCGRPLQPGWKACPYCGEKV